jgi:hypothetical protein
MDKLKRLIRELIAYGEILKRELERADVKVLKVLKELDDILSELNREDKLHEAHIEELERFLHRLQAEVRKNPTKWGLVKVVEEINFRRDIDSRINIVVDFVNKLRAQVAIHHHNYQSQFLKQPNPFAYLYHEKSVGTEYPKAIVISKEGMQSLIDELNINMKIYYVKDYTKKCTEIIDEVLKGRQEMSTGEADTIMHVMIEEDIMERRKPHFDMVITVRAYKNGWFGSHPRSFFTKMPSISMITIYAGHSGSYRRIPDESIFRVAKHEFGHTFFFDDCHTHNCIMNHGLTGRNLCSKCKRQAIEYIEGLEVETRLNIFRR